jgi:hypothetical protein
MKERRRSTTPAAAMAEKSKTQFSNSKEIPNSNPQVIREWTGVSRSIGPLRDATRRTVFTVTRDSVLECGGPPPLFAGNHPVNVYMRTYD